MNSFQHLWHIVQLPKFAGHLLVIVLAPKISSVIYLTMDVACYFEP